jgi:hypothetical protein
MDIEARSSRRPRTTLSQETIELREALERGDRVRILELTRAVRERDGAPAMLRMLSTARGFPPSA